MEITRACARSSEIGPEEYFTGDVRLDPLFDPDGDARGVGLSVTFEPGARTAWHTHPLGQTLVITEGCGLVQREDGPVEKIQAGDIVWFPPNEKHWHGARPERSMTHIAVHERLDGETVSWLEEVTDEEYHAFDQEE